MAKEKKLVEAITPMGEDFAQWYTDVVKKAELVEYSSVRGCMILRPNGYAIWENITHKLDARFKAVGVENVSLPLLIPESLLQKEKDHVEGLDVYKRQVSYSGALCRYSRMPAAAEGSLWSSFCMASRVASPPFRR